VNHGSMGIPRGCRGGGASSDARVRKRTGHSAKKTEHGQARKNNRRELVRLMWIRLGAILSQHMRD
jgi:hypothetical protein